jgi:hypothetical protein
MTAGSEAGVVAGVETSIGGVGATLFGSETPRLSVCAADAAPEAVWRGTAWTTDGVDGGVCAGGEALAGLDAAAETGRPCARDGAASLGAAAATAVGVETGAGLGGWATVVAPETLRPLVSAKLNVGADAGPADGPGPVVGPLTTAGVGAASV